MDIFESLENLPVSEACFENIIGLVEEYINEYQLRKTVANQTGSFASPLADKAEEIDAETSLDSNSSIHSRKRQEPSRRDRRFTNRPYLKNLKKFIENRANNDSHFTDLWQNLLDKDKKVDDIATNKAIDRNARKIIKKQLTPDLKKLQKEGIKLQDTRKGNAEDSGLKAQIANAVNLYSKDTNAKAEALKDLEASNKRLLRTDSRIKTNTNKQGKVNDKIGSQKKRSEEASQKVKDLIAAIGECCNSIIYEDREPGEPLSSFKDRLQNKFIPKAEYAKSVESSIAKHNQKVQKRKNIPAYEQTKKNFNTAQKMHNINLGNLKTAQEIENAVKQMFGGEHAASQHSNVKTTNAQNTVQASKEARNKAFNANKEAKKTVADTQAKIEGHHAKAAAIRDKIGKMGGVDSKTQKELQQELKGVKKEVPSGSSPNPANKNASIFKDFLDQLEKDTLDGKYDTGRTYYGTMS